MEPKNVTNVVKICANIKGARPILGTNEETVGKKCIYNDTAHRKQKLENDSKI